MKTILGAALVLLTACGSDVLKSIGGQDRPAQKGFAITSFESVYDDGHTTGPSFRHTLRYDRATGVVTLSKSAYMIDPNTLHVTVTPEKKATIDQALDSINTNEVADSYHGLYADALAMNICLRGSGQEQTTTIGVDDIEKTPAGLHFIFQTSLGEGQYYRE